MIRLVKVGGHCAYPKSDVVARTLASFPDGKLLIVVGYGARLAEVLQRQGVQRRRFVTASGVTAHFTDEMSLAASHFAAVAEMLSLSSALETLGKRVACLVGFRGFLLGTRKKRIRYREGSILRIHTTDLSGQLIEVKPELVRELFEVNDYVVTAPLLTDEEGGLLVCDADHAALRIAQHLAVTEVTILTDVDAFRGAGGEPVSAIPQSEISQYLPFAEGGMRKKLHYIQESLASGVRTIWLRNGKGMQGGGTRFHVD